MSSPYGPPPATGQPRPRPGSQQVRGGPAFQQQPRYVDYGTPRAYDTTTRRASGFTRPRHDPAQMHRPDQAVPESAWATQTRRIQAVQAQKQIVPFQPILAWIVAGLFGIGLVLVLGGLFVLSVMQSADNLIWWPVSAVQALISLLVIIGIVVLADRWDPQPIALVLIAVSWGAAGSVFMTLVIGQVTISLAAILTGSPAATEFFAVVINAPIVEEITKGLGLLVLLFLARRYFNGPLDGLIYGSLIGGGFAFTENILYYSQVGVEAGVIGLLLLGFMRGVLGIFGHAIYTGLTGVLMGLIVRKWGTGAAALSFLIAPLGGMLLHAVWNLGATVISTLGPMLLLFFAQFVLSCLYLVLIGILVWDEARLTRLRLGDYANHGWLTHEEVAMLATWRGRREGRQWASSIGQKPLMKKFIREAADLASVRQRLLADGQAPRAVALEQSLLTRLEDNRRQLLQAAR